MRDHGPRDVERALTQVERGASAACLWVTLLSLRMCSLSCKFGTLGFQDPFYLSHLMDSTQRKGRKYLSYVVLVVLVRCCEAGDVSKERQRECR